MTDLRLDDARRAIDAVVAHAAALGRRVSVVILDAGGTAVASARMDGARLIACESSIAKGRAALMFGTPTADLVAAVQPGAALFGVSDAVAAPLALIPGGVPAVVGDDLVGAVGVGGATPQEDHEMASLAVGVLTAPSSG